ncbi:hypothetical protein EDD86DRAFT_206860 [Gorgonomyces haynaldii]|nr:hypothetical protein EDD86DRAFT_206860 [Gorgonomyces haynaldii]
MIQTLAKQMYFPKLPDFASILGLSLDSGTIAMFSTGINHTDTSSLGGSSELPMMKLEIANWTYTIIRQTSANIGARTRTFGQYTVSDAEDASLIQFGNAFDLNCIANSQNPWSTCSMPDSVNFTIFQRIPMLSNVSTYDSSVYTTNVFDVDKTSIGVPKGYVLTGKLVFSRNWIALTRDPTYLNLTLHQTDPIQFENKQIGTYLETLYKQLKAVSVITMYYQFNSNYKGYYWSQLREFVIASDLLPEFGDYAQTDFIHTMESRLSSTVQFWISRMAMSQARIPVVVYTGTTTEQVYFGMGVIAGFGLYIVWTILLIVAIAFIFILRRNRRRQLDPMAIRGYSLTQWVEYFWSRPYSLLLLQNTLEQPSKPTGFDPRKIRIDVTEEDMYIVQEGGYGRQGLFKRKPKSKTSTMKESPSSVEGTLKKTHVVKTHNHGYYSE